MRARHISPATRSMSSRLDRVGERRLKWTYVTRLVPQTAVAGIGPNSKTPGSGDLVVARVYAVAAHDHIEDPVGRAQRLYPGDLIVGAYGNRYATDFYEGYVPRGPQTHLLTTGGLIGTVASAHDAVKEPTKLEICGALSGQDGRPLALADFACPAPPPVVPPLGTIVVVGSSMNAGKTTTVVSIVRGLTQAGLVVGAGKVTGSGSGKDRWAYIDAGAALTADFLDYGMPSTFGYPREQIAQTMAAIRHRLADEGAEVVVLEIADGLLQCETGWLLQRLVGVADAVVFAAVDPLSACFGVEILRRHGLPVRAVSGLVTRSPLARREVMTGLPLLSATELVSGGALGLLDAERREEHASACLVS
jgi:hypothetical protein